MPMGTPLVQAEQDRSIRIEDLTEVIMGGSRLRQAKQRLVPLEAARHIANANDRPRAPHGAPPARRINVSGLFDEAIAESMDSNNVLRLGWGRFDFLTKLGDVVINRARNRAALIPPNLVEQLIACDDFSSAADQV